VVFVVLTFLLSSSRISGASVELIKLKFALRNVHLYLFPVLQHVL